MEIAKGSDRAKSKGIGRDLNKAAFIRSFPLDTPVKQVVMKAREVGIAVSENYVHDVRSVLKKAPVAMGRPSAKFAPMAAKPAPKSAPKPGTPKVAGPTPVAAKPRVFARPAASKPVTPKSLAAEPGTPNSLTFAKPTVSKPVAPKPAASKLATPRPVAPKPVAAKPAAPKPVAPVPVAFKPAITRTAAPTSVSIVKAPSVVRSAKPSAAPSKAAFVRSQPRSLTAKAVVAAGANVGLSLTPDYVHKVHSESHAKAKTAPKTPIKQPSTPTQRTPTKQALAFAAKKPAATPPVAHAVRTPARRPPAPAAKTPVKQAPAPVAKPPVTTKPAAKSAKPARRAAPARPAKTITRGSGPEGVFRDFVLEFGVSRARTLILDVERKLSALIAGR